MAPSLQTRWVDDMYPGDPEAGGFCVQQKSRWGQCVEEQERGAHPTPVPFDQSSVWPGRGPRSSRQPKLTGLANHVLVAPVRVEGYQTAVANHAANRPRFVLLHWNSGCRNGTTGSRENAVAKTTQRVVATAKLERPDDTWPRRFGSSEREMMSSRLQVHNDGGDGRFRLVAGSRPRHPSPTALIN